MDKIRKSEGFLGKLLGPVLKAGLPLIGNVLKPLAKSVLMIMLMIVSNKEMNDIMNIVKSIEEFLLLIQVVSKTIKNKAKEQKASTLGAILVGNLLAGKDAIKAGEGKIRADQDFQCRFIL